MIDVYLFVLTIAFGEALEGTDGNATGEESNRSVGCTPLHYGIMI